MQSINFLDRIPNEIVNHIFGFLEYKEQTGIRRAGRRYRYFCKAFPDMALAYSLYAELKRITSIIDIEGGKPRLLKENRLDLASGVRKHHVYPLDPHQVFFAGHFNLKVLFKNTHGFIFRGDIKIVSIELYGCSKQLSLRQKNALLEAVKRANKKLTHKVLWKYADINED